MGRGLLLAAVARSLFSSLILSFHQAVINPFTLLSSSHSLHFFFLLLLLLAFTLTHSWSNPINPLLMAMREDGDPWVD